MAKHQQKKGKGAMARMRLAQTDRRVIALRLSREGKTQAEIALELGVERSTISKDIAYYRRLADKTNVKTFEEMRDEEIAEIRRVQDAAWEAWRRSQEDEETHKETNEGVKRKIEKTRKGQVGDARYLSEVQKCIERRCKLYGLDAPEKYEVTGKDGGPVIREVIVESREDVKQMLTFKEVQEAENEK